MLTRFPRPLFAKLTLLCGAAFLPLLTAADDAHACGCFSPPIPQPAEVNFAVNQQAEQIIFEVDEGVVTAHVLIRYAGDPESFGWLLPVPSVPDIQLSNSAIFGLVDQQTQPIVSAQQQNVCPQQEYFCRTHPPCPTRSVNEVNAAQAGAPAPGVLLSADDSVASDGAGNVAAPPVTVYQREIVGDYDTVVLGSGDAELVVAWLNDNGFITNATMAPFMQPYLDAEMLFVASKLVPGADVDELRPLRLTYEADAPFIPLQLTPIAAEPHLTVTAFIYSDQEFEPLDQELTEVPAEYIAQAPGRANNYPMALARAVDEAGGSAFVTEYVGAPPRFSDPTGCCGGGSPTGMSADAPDICFVGGDGLCQCPTADFDAADCEGQEDLATSMRLADELAQTYPVFTRLSTRVSPEEMDFDPAFVPAGPSRNFRLSLQGQSYNLRGCEEQVVPDDRDSLNEMTALEACSGVYCGDGECVVTEEGAACDCDEGFVARSFTDLDGGQSVTCVPDVPPVDLSFGGLELPSVCSSVNNGECLELGGFPASRCDEGFAALAGGPVIAGEVQAAPRCSEITFRSGGSGARNYTSGIPELAVCAPLPPTCPSSGWLEKREVTIQGVACEGTTPHESWLEETPKPVCASDLPDLPIAQDSLSSSAQPTQPMDTSKPRPEMSSGDSDDGGCSLGAPSASSTTSWWLLALLLPVLRRRRAD